MGNLNARRLVIYAAIAAVLVAGVIFLLSLYAGLPKNLKNLIVLLEDPDGKVGVVAVAGAGSQQVLSRPREATGTSSAADPPRPPFMMTEAEINEIFGDVIKGRPLLPASFTLIFQPGVSILASASVQLDQIVAEIQRRPVSRVAIYGHASSTGNAAINLQVSLFRARAVRDALGSRGLDTREFIVESLGSRDPAAPSPNGAATPDNLRVEVVVR